MTTEEKNAYKAIAKKHTKDELVEKALNAHTIVGSLVELLRVLSLDPDGLSAVQRTVYESKHARDIRSKARVTAAHIVSSYDKAQEDANFEPEVIAPTE